MKRYWIVVENGNVLVEDDDFSGHITFVSEAQAEQRARSFAQERPGKRYSVFMSVSSFVVNIMTEERAT